MIASSGCSPTEDPPRWNVILIVVDTLRADHTSLYGYSRETNPFLETWAERAVVFEGALSQAGCTFPSVNSMLTSRYPQEFLTRLPDLGIPAEVPPLSEILSDAGYATAAVSASRIVRNTPSQNNRYGGFGLGFDEFDESCEARRATCVRGQAIEAIDRLERPFFLYAHFMDPHAPYLPPRWHEREFATEPPKKRWVRKGSPKPIQEHVYRDGPGDYEPEDVDFLRDLYDDEILHFDREFESFVADLDARGLSENTLIVLTSDHGEAFLEHGEFTHCRDIAYNSVLRIPLVVALPGRAHSGRRAALAQNLDVVPTILDYLRIETSDLELAGRSLRPSIEHDRPVHRHLFSSQGMMRVVTDGDRKLIHNIQTGESELYDWRNDVSELDELSEREPEVAERLRSALFAWVESVEGTVGAQSSIDDAREIEKELRAVGYL